MDGQLRGREERGRRGAGWTAPRRLASSLSTSWTGCTVRQTSSASLSISPGLPQRPRAPPSAVQLTNDLPSPRSPLPQHDIPRTPLHLPDPLPHALPTPTAHEILLRTLLYLFSSQTEQIILLPRLTRSWTWTPCDPIHSSWEKVHKERELRRSKTWAGVWFHFFSSCCRVFCSR